MARSSSYSDDDNATIVRMRATGAGWKAIGATLHRAPEGVRDHSYRTGIAQRTAPITQHASAPMNGRNQEPLPAFHPVTWGAIWNGLNSRP
jgi:hypothetical protein